MKFTRISLIVILGAVVALITYPSNAQLKNNTEEEQHKSSLTTSMRTALLKNEMKKNGEFEIFSMWGESGEYEAIKKLIYQFKEENPTVNLIYAATSGGGTGNIRDVLKDRLKAGDYPESFIFSNKFKPAEQYYYNLDDWVGTEKENFPSIVIDYFSDENHLYAVPLNVHRMNILWYKPELLEKYHIQLPNSLDELLLCFEELKSRGVTPILMDSSTNLNTLIGLSITESSKHKETIMQIQQGKLKMRHNPIVQELRNIFVSYIDVDNAPANWQTAAEQFLKEDIVFYISGDWSKGYMTETLQYELGKDFDAIVFPGTEGTYVSVIDAFGISAFINDKATAQSWINKLLSQEAQIEFNIAKGSIPARTDISQSHFDAYSVKSMHDYRESIENETLIIIVP